MEKFHHLPSCEETANHPAYSGAIWNLEPHQKGAVTVGRHRGRPVNIAWEIHGDGPTKLVLLMGLAGLTSSWQRQTLHFGHDHGHEYSVLLIENRGIGASDKPFTRYSTPEMARDVLAVLDHVGWTADRSIHAVGISLGGMIMQELACLVPERLSSLNLLSTTAKFETAMNWRQNMAEKVSFFRPKTMAEQIDDTARKVFPAEWLAAPDEDILPAPGLTPHCGPPNGGSDDHLQDQAREKPQQYRLELPDFHHDYTLDYHGMIKDVTLGSSSDADAVSSTIGNPYSHFDTNYQRFQAEEIVKRTTPNVFSKKGFVCQIGAAGSHHKTPEQLNAMADAVGRERIAIMHGNDDNMIPVANGEKLMIIIRPGIAHIVPGMGHAAPTERTAWFNEWLENRIANGERMDGRRR